MKIIRDIRLYKDTAGINNKILNLAAHRVAMKLREKAFSPGEYDHLYLRFTLNQPEGSVTLDEKIDRYFPWFRNVYVGISQDDLLSLETSDDSTLLFKYLENALLVLYGGDSSVEKIIAESIEDAKKGPEMMMHFKEKKAAKGTATIYLKLLDNSHYLPVLSVTDTSGTEVLRKNLPETVDLGNMGEIQFNSKKVTIKPRKNAFTKGMKSIVFDINL